MLLKIKHISRGNGISDNYCSKTFHYKNIHNILIGFSDVTRDLKLLYALPKTGWEGLCMI